MDELSIKVLKAEVEADLLVIQDAAKQARARYGSGAPQELESCAFQLVRLYNAIEQMGLRVAKAFENHIDDERGWHTELIRRLSLAIPEIRPAFFSKEALADLHNLRGFRHVVVHAYDLILVGDRVNQVVESAEKTAQLLPSLLEKFFEIVKSETSQ